jgi:hypothetical protein
LSFSLGSEGEGRGKNSLDPPFFLRVFRARLWRGQSDLRTGQFAPEVYELRRLTVQLTRPFVKIIKTSSLKAWSAQARSAEGWDYAIKQKLRTCLPQPPAKDMPQT